MSWSSPLEVEGIYLQSFFKKNKFPLLPHLGLSEYVLLTVKMYVEEVDFLESKMRQLETLAHRECTSSKYCKNYKILTTIPGIGPITAGSLCFEIGDWSRFKSAKQLCAYLGLTPREYSSGEHIYRGKITVQGNPSLRSYLTEASWKTAANDPVIKEFYNRVKANSGSGKKAIVAVARKMVHRMYSMI